MTMSDKAPHCQLHDASMFIGLCTLPLGKRNEFIKGLEHFVENLSARHMARLGVDCWPNCKESVLYKPYVYYVLGAFDAAVLSLVDDYGVGIRFHSSNALWGETTGVPNGDIPTAALKFAHKTILGPMPDFRDTDAIGRRLTAEGVARRVFEPTDGKPLPLLGICQLKLDSGTLIGTGTDFVRCVFWTIRSLHEEYRKKKVRLEVLPLESYSWHEITLLLFSDSYKTILDFVVDLREMDLKEMKARLRPSHDSDWEQFDSLRNFRREVNAELAADTATQSKAEPPLSAHIFWTSSTVLGFRIDCAQEDRESAYHPISDEKDLCALSSWTAKAGHMRELARVVNRLAGDHDPESIMICSGRGDFIWPAGTFEGIQMSSRQFVAYRDKTHSETAQADLNPVVHSFDTNSLLVTRRDWKPAKGLRTEAKHLVLLPELHARLLKAGLLYDVAKVRRIRNQMVAARVRHVVARRVLNVFALYNQGLLDPFLFTYFLSLAPLIKALEEEVGRAAVSAAPASRTDTAEDARDAARGTYHRAVQTMVEISGHFENAWHNRFHASWTASDISDFNLDFKGGVHQLVYAIDAAYKLVHGDIGARHEDLYRQGGAPAAREPVAVIGSRPIRTTNFTIELSYHDLLTPEYFAARAAHEAADRHWENAAKKSHEFGSPFAGVRDPMGEHAEYAAELVRAFWRAFYKKMEPPRASAGKEGQTKLDEERLQVEHLQRLQEETWGEIWADTHAYYYTYFGERDLFAYWYSGLLYANSDYWLPRRQSPWPQTPDIYLWLLRVTAVLVASTFVPGNEGDPARNDALKDLKQLLHQFRGYVDKAWEFVTHSVELAERQSDQSATGLTGLAKWKFGDWLLRVARRVTRRIPPPGADDVLRQLSLCYREDMSRGVPPAFIPREWDTAAGSSDRKEPTPTEFVRAVCHAYLRLLRDGFSPNGGEALGTHRGFSRLDASSSQLIYLPRRILDDPLEDGTIDNDRLLPGSRMFANLLFDTRGDTRARGPAFNRDHLRWRAAYVMSLWDYAAKYATLSTLIDRKAAGRPQDTVSQ